MAETTEQYRTRINQLESSILTEPYMVEMRSDISEGIGKTGNRQADIENRQKTIEDDFVTVQTDASNANPSGAEVAVARGSYSTLDQRLDEKEQEVTAQLTQTDENATLAHYEQEDFIETLLKYYAPKNMVVVPNNFDNKNFSIVYELGGGKGIRYLVGKNNDGFAILKNGQVGDLDPIANVLANQVDYLYGTSNKEFAFNLKEKGSSEDYFFIPAHNVQPTAFDDTPPRYFVDGSEVSSLTDVTATEIKDKFTIVQYLVFYKPNTTTEIAKGTVFMVFNKNGRVDINTKIKATLNLDISYGYVNMLPVKTAFGNKLLTSYGNEYPTIKTDGSRTNLTEKDLSKSYVFLNDSTTNNIAVAMTMQKHKQTMRIGKTGRPSLAPVWIEHRSTDIQKLYPMPLSNAEMAAGEVYSFGGSYLMANVENVNNLLG